MQNPLWTCCVHKYNMGLRATLQWIKMRGSLWHSSGGEGSAGKIFLLCAGPSVDILCSREQPRIKDNIIVDYDGWLSIPYNYLLKRKMLL